MNDRRRVRKAAAFACILGAAALVLGGCGDDKGESSKPRKPAKARAGKAKAAAKPAARNAANSVQKYQKIDDSLRRTFLERDFNPDPAGDGNRDPFRSYVVRQPGAETGTLPLEDNDVCRNTKRKQNWKAPTYSIRDLSLIGIIMRGTRGYAQFLDRSGEGWIVTQNNCLGVEKAIVSSIGSGVVRLQVRPDAPVGGIAPPPVARDIPLYPKEYEIDTDE